MNSKSMSEEEKQAEKMALADAGRELQTIILEAVRSKSVFTDIHIEQDEVIRWKRPMGWEDLPGKPIATSEMIKGLCYVLSEDWYEELDKFGSFKKSIPMTECRLRLNVFYTYERSKIALSIRRHPLQPIKLKNLSLSKEAINMLSWHTKGLVIVTGSTGSGKTTTLSSIIDYYNHDAIANKQNRQLHVITIEQPIEYVHERDNAIISAKDVPVDTPSFTQGLKDALSQRPDIILIGEVNDVETAETMFLAAESGHLVFATLHTNSAVSALTKLLSFFPEDEHAMRRMMMANTLLGVLSQVMVPNRSGEGYEVVTEEFLVDNKKIIDRITEGNFTAIQNAIDKGEDKQDRRDGKAEDKYVSLNTKLLTLIKENKISPESAVRASYKPQEMMEIARTVLLSR